MNLEILRGASGIRQIYDEWSELARRCGAGRLMQFPDYYLSFAEKLLTDPNGMLIAAFRDDRALVAVLPLQFTIRKKLGISFGVVEFPATPSPIREFIALDNRSLADLVGCLKKQFQPVFGKPVDMLRLSGFTVSDFEAFQAAGGSGISSVSNIGKNNYIQLTDGDYMQEKLSSNMRSNLRRRRKRLDKLGAAEFKTVTQLPELNSAFDAFVETEAAGWKSERGGKRAIKLHEDQLSFYRDLTSRFAKTGRCHIHLLTLDGNPIASDFCLVSGNSVASLKHGYDEQFTDVTPSNLLREYTIEYYAQDNAVDVIDLVSGYAWQDRWKPDHRSVCLARDFNHTFKGQLLRLVTSLRERSAHSK